MYSLLLGLFYLFLGFSTYRKFREKWINDKIGNADLFHSDFTHRKQLRHRYHPRCCAVIPITFQLPGASTSNMKSAYLLSPRMGGAHDSR